MRLWTIHPQYLDPQGLVALWREALLARAVLREQTRGYRHHPQLERFRAHAFPRSAINTYLAAIHSEAAARGYAFDKRKIGPLSPVHSISTTTEQYCMSGTFAEKTIRAEPSVAPAVAHSRCPAVSSAVCAGPGLIEPWERTGHSDRPLTFIGADTRHRLR